MKTCAGCGHPIDETQMHLHLKTEAFDAERDAMYWKAYATLDHYFHSISCVVIWDVAQLKVRFPRDYK